MLSLSRVIALFFCLVIPSVVQAQVIINEIAWMGTELSANDEWVELYNDSDSVVSLDGWMLKSVDGTPNILLEGQIPSKGFFILERTDDETLPNITADLIYTGALQNTGEYLQLLDDSGNIIDSINCSSEWLAGDNATKQTMEKTDSGWQTSQDTGGTPKAINRRFVKEVEEPVVYASGIIFNEILPSPEGVDAEEEWIEIKNLNNEEIDLSGWQIQDLVGAQTVYIIPDNTKISANGYLVFDRPTTNITLNNEADTLQLISPDNNVADEITYNKAPRGQSFCLINSNWAWNTNITPGSINIIQRLDNKDEEIKSLDYVKEEISNKELPVNSERDLKKRTNHFSVIIIALSIALFSGLIIFILKQSVKPELDKFE